MGHAGNMRDYGTRCCGSDIKKLGICVKIMKNGRDPEGLLGTFTVFDGLMNPIFHGSYAMDVHGITALGPGSFYHFFTC